MGSIVNMVTPAICGFDQLLHDEDVQRCIRLTISTGECIVLTLECGCPFIAYERCSQS